MNVFPDSNWPVTMTRLKRRFSHVKNVKKSVWKTRICHVDPLSMTIPPSLVGYQEKREGPNLLLTGKSNFNFVVKLQTNDYLYRATTEDVDYLENQCADSRSYGMCDYQEYPESDLGFGDLQITTRSKEEVKLSFCLQLFSGQAEVANSHTQRSRNLPDKSRSIWDVSDHLNYHHLFHHRWCHQSCSVNNEMCVCFSAKRDVTRQLPSSAALWHISLPPACVDSVAMIICLPVLQPWQPDEAPTTTKKLLVWIVSETIDACD